MRKSMIYPLTAHGLLAGCLIGISATSAFAIPEFNEAFRAKYVKPESSESNDVALAQAASQAKCSICHMGNNKRVRNAYGKELSKLISRRDGRNRAKIETAFDAVTKLKSDAADPQSPTFGERLASGKFPVTAAAAGPEGGFGPPGPPPEGGSGRRGPWRPGSRPGEPGDRQFGPGPGGPPDGPDSPGPTQPPVRKPIALPGPLGFEVETV
ncbi:MAG: hypothetical protein ABSG53_10265 [Thermoguttaceae bacterium]|jgi:hypothetical protein